MNHETVPDHSGSDSRRTTALELARAAHPLVDCPDEKNHVWERLKDGSAFCIWCDARVRRVGR